MNESKNICTQEGLESGIVAGAKAGGVAGIVVLGLNQLHRGFRTKLGVSGKVACVVMPLFFNFVLASEHSISACRNREYLFRRSMSLEAGVGTEFGK